MNPVLPIKSQNSLSWLLERIDGRPGSGLYGSKKEDSEAEGCDNGMIMQSPVLVNII
jgi:hypothetical protein